MQSIILNFNCCDFIFPKLKNKIKVVKYINLNQEIEVNLSLLLCINTNRKYTYFIF